jgi:hypothetical protein
VNGWTKWDTTHSVSTGVFGGSAGYLAYLAGYGQIGCAVIAGGVALVASTLWDLVIRK